MQQIFNVYIVCNDYFGDICVFVGLAYILKE